MNLDFRILSSPMPKSVWELETQVVVLIMNNVNSRNKKLLEEKGWWIKLTFPFYQLFYVSWW